MTNPSNRTDVTDAMIEAGGEALANQRGMERGAPPIRGVLNMLPAHMAKGFRDDASAVIEAALRSAQPVDQEEVSRDRIDALRYRRLRTLGCAPDTWDGLERGEVLRFTNLDAFADADLAHAERNDSRGAKPAATLLEKLGAKQ